MTSVYGVDVSGWPTWKKEAAWEDMGSCMLYRYLYEPAFIGGASPQDVFEVAMAATRVPKIAKEFSSKVREARSLQG